MNSRDVQFNATFERVKALWFAIYALQISEEYKLRCLFTLASFLMALRAVEKMPYNRKRYRKRTAALRHRANRILKLANQTLDDEIRAAFEGK